MCILSCMTITLSETDLLKQKNEILEAQVKSLQEQIDWLKRQLFGQKSERFISSEADQFLPGFYQATLLVLQDF